MLFLYGAETALFFGACRVYGLGDAFFMLFWAVQTAFCAVIAGFLLLNRPSFYNVHTNMRETRVNFANKITLFRISMLPFLVFLIFASNRRSVGPSLLIALAVTFASDFLDGRIARTKRLETHIGRILDSASDYVLLGTTAWAFFFFKVIKTWLFLLIIGRLFINALGMMILSLVRKKLLPQTTRLGKIAIAAIMILFVIETAAAIFGPWPWVAWIECAAAAVIGLSVIDKLLYFIRSMQAATTA